MKCRGGALTVTVSSPVLVFVQLQTCNQLKSSCIGIANVFYQKIAIALSALAFSDVIDVALQARDVFAKFARDTLRESELRATPLRGGGETGELARIGGAHPPPTLNELINV